MSLNIDDAFIQKFIDSDFELPIAHENQSFDPNPEIAYAQLNVMHNPRTAVGISSTDLTTGIFRIILRYPQFEGAIPAKTKAEEILSEFKINTILTAQSQKSQVYRIHRESGLPEDGWYKIVLSIFFESILTRT